MREAGEAEAGGGGRRGEAGLPGAGIDFTPRTIALPAPNTVATFIVNVDRSNCGAGANIFNNELEVQCRTTPTPTPTPTPTRTCLSVLVKRREKQYFFNKNSKRMSRSINRRCTSQESHCFPRLPFLKEGHRGS